MVLNLPGEKHNGNSNCAGKVFPLMGHDGLVGGGSNLELLPEFHHM